MSPASTAILTNNETQEKIVIKSDDVYKIGKIGKPHGVSGELNMAFDDDVFDRTDAEYLILEVDGILVPFFMEEYRFRSDSTVLVKFCDIDTQEAARGLTGCDVFFPRQHADADADVATWNELVGFTVVDEATGNVVGRVTGVDDSTVNLLFEVQTQDGEELLLPAHEELIADFDRDSRTVSMHLPDGILDQNAQ